MIIPLKAPRDIPNSNPNYWDYVKFPLLGSIKFDGVRAIVHNNKVYSKTFKPLRSFQVQETFGIDSCDGFDGELIVGEPNSNRVYHNTYSHVMSFDKPGDVKLYVFDSIQHFNLPFKERLAILKSQVQSKPLNTLPIELVEHVELRSRDEVQGLFEQVLQKGFEGLMLRNPDARYKFNRATMLDNIIFKMKTIDESEGIIVDIEEGTINTNEQTRDSQGYAFRSDAGDNRVPSGRVGRFIVNTEEYGDIKVSPGKFTHKQLEEFLRDPSKVLGKGLVYKWMNYGVKDQPRQASAIRLRED